MYCGFPQTPTHPLIITGGGRRCKDPGCTKAAQGKGGHCKFHGGGRRCVEVGCTRSAKGKVDKCSLHNNGAVAATTNGPRCEASW